MGAVSERLQCLAEICASQLNGLYEKEPRVYTLADIGCDHAYLGLLLCEKLSEDRLKVIASDVGEGPLTAAREHITRAALGHRIETRLADGLSGLSAGEADVLVVSGMGAEQIMAILEAGDDTVRSAKRLVLSAHTKASLLRHYCNLSGLKVLREEVLFEEPKYYHIDVIDPAHFTADGAVKKAVQTKVSEYTDFELFGNTTREELLHRKMQHERALNALAAAKQDTLERKKELRDLIARMERYIDETDDTGNL